MSSSKPGDLYVLVNVELQLPRGLSTPEVMRGLTLPCEVSCLFLGEDEALLKIQTQDGLTKYLKNRRHTAPFTI